MQHNNSIGADGRKPLVLSSVSLPLGYCGKCIAIVGIRGGNSIWFVQLVKSWNRCWVSCYKYTGSNAINRYQSYWRIWIKSSSQYELYQQQSEGGIVEVPSELKIWMNYNSYWVGQLPNASSETAFRGKLTLARTGLACPRAKWFFMLTNYWRIATILNDCNCPDCLTGALVPLRQIHLL